MTKISDLGYWIDGANILWGWEEQGGRAGFLNLFIYLIFIYY